MVSGEESWMTLVIVQLPGANETGMAQDVSSRGVAVANPIIQIVSSGPRPAFEMPELSLIDESGEAPDTAGDPISQSMLFGRYTGQIDARIQRAWRKPRGAITNLLQRQVRSGVKRVSCRRRAAQ
jgi:hypothetical protein